MQDNNENTNTPIPNLIEQDGQNRHERRHRHEAENGHGHMHHHEEQAGDPGRRNFWRDWRNERHDHGHGWDMPVGQILSPKEMDAWREFFHKSFGNWPEDHWIFGGRRFSPWHQGMDSFNPFVASLLSKGGGLLPLYVLHLVAQKPRYGNEIMDLLAARTNGQWVSNPGAIYPLLTLLEREGFIAGEWEDPAKRTVRIYTLTPAGQEEFARIKTIISPKIEETVNVLNEFLQDMQNQTLQSEAAQTAPSADHNSEGA